jgi:hypothetical protein
LRLLDTTGRVYMLPYSVAQQGSTVPFLLFLLASSAKCYLILVNKRGGSR